MSIGISFSGGILSYIVEKGFNPDEIKIEGAFKRGALAMISGTFSFFTGAITSFNIANKANNFITSNFVQDIFSQPITWLMSLIEEKI